MHIMKTAWALQLIALLLLLAIPGAALLDCHGDCDDCGAACNYCSHTCTHAILHDALLIAPNPDNRAHAADENEAVANFSPSGVFVPPEATA